MGLKDVLFGKTVQPDQIPFEELERLDVGKAAKEGLKFQEENIEQAQAIASKADLEAQERSIDLLNKALPGFSDFQSQLGDVFSEIATDPFDLPESVQRFMKQQAAERGISGGFAGSEFGEFDLVRNLGMEALQLGNQRIGQAQNLFQTLVSTAPTVNPTSALSLVPGAGQFIAGEQFNIENVDKFNIIAKQNFLQAQENQRAASAARRGLIPGITSGFMTGMQTGNPWAAVGGAVIGGAESAILRKPSEGGSGAFVGDGAPFAGGGGMMGMFGGGGGGGGGPFGGMFKGMFGGGSQGPAGPKGTGVGGTGVDMSTQFISDRRLKKNIKRVGTHPKGFGIYDYEYLGSEKKIRGVMADEVNEIVPSAVMVMDNGFLSIDYSKL